jgi:hypothetical protein
MFRYVLSAVLVALIGLAIWTNLGPSKDEQLATVRSDLADRLTQLRGTQQGCADHDDISAAVERIMLTSGQLGATEYVAFDNCALPVFGDELDKQLFSLRQINNN